MPATCKDPAALTLLAASCGGSDAYSCEALADEAIGLIQNMIDEIYGMSVIDLANAHERPAITNLGNDFEALEAKADGLNCSNAEIDELFMERVDNLTAETRFGELMLEGFKQEAGGGF